MGSPKSINSILISFFAYTTWLEPIWVTKNKRQHKILSLFALQNFRDRLLKVMLSVSLSVPYRFFVRNPHSCPPWACRLFGKPKKWLKKLLWGVLTVGLHLQKETGKFNTWSKNQFFCEKNFYFSSAYA